MAKPQEIKKAKRGSISDKAKFVIKNTAKDVAKDVMTLGGGAGLGVKAAVKAGAKVATKAAAKKVVKNTAKKVAEPKSAVKVTSPRSGINRRIVNTRETLRTRGAKDGSKAKFDADYATFKNVTRQGPYKPSPAKVIKIKGK